MEKVPVPSPTVCAVSPVSANWRTWVLRQAWSLSLYCTVLYCTVLYCTVLYCTVLYYAVLYCTWEAG